MRMFLATALAAGALGLAACSTVNNTPAAPSTTSPSTTAPGHGATGSPGAPGNAPQAPAPGPSMTPWAVVSAYYGDIESGDYAGAWQLIGSGATTGQSYQQFVDGFACTGAQQLTDLGTSGDQVSFDLAATNTCTGQVQTYTGTDTVQNGQIVAANVTQTG